MPKIITNYIPRYESECNDNMPEFEDILNNRGCWIGQVPVKLKWRTE